MKKVFQITLHEKALQKYNSKTFLFKSITKTVIPIK